MDNSNQLRILEKHEIACEDVVEMLGDHVEGELIPTLKARVESHIDGCECCQEFEEQYRLTIELARELGNKPVPVAVRRRLRSALNERLGLNLPQV